jgi:AAA domain
MNEHQRQMLERLDESLGNNGDSPRSENDQDIFIEFLSPSQLRDYEPPEGVVLIGDNHIVRGSVFVIGGPPGVGKSRAAVALAEAGATGCEWFGLKVHCEFRTLIVQNENGRYRLKQEFSELDCEKLESYVRVSPPPPYGLCFDRLEFREQLCKQIDAFEPAVVLLDPWNAASRDDKSRGYLETFDAIRSVIPAGDAGPAIGIVAHTRKPQIGERASGRALLNLLAGSYVLGSVPRTVFIMQSASDSVSEDKVVWTCCKNNDGVLGPRSAWIRANGLFTPVVEFDWHAFDNPSPEKDLGITKGQVAAVFQDGRLKLPRAEAVKRLQEITQKGKTVCYDALKRGGKFDENLSEENGSLVWKE